MWSSLGLCTTSFRPLHLLRNLFTLRTYAHPLLHSLRLSLEKTHVKSVKQTSIRFITAPPLTKQVSRPKIALPVPPMTCT
ncbi:hypothetical protein WG66_007459 [Moniliophthora roreri]|nr:hypothetical protein WG66_007459 [Moniliophthora roreri]